MASSKEIFKLAKEIFADVTNSEEKLQQMRVLLNNYVTERKDVNAEKIAKNITKAFTEAFKKHFVEAGDNPNTIKALFAAQGAELSEEDFSNEEKLAHIETILSQVAVWIRDESTPLLTVAGYVEKLSSAQNEPDAEEVAAPKLVVAAPSEEEEEEEVVAPVVAPVVTRLSSTELLEKLARRSAKLAADAPKQVAPASVAAPAVVTPVVAPTATLDQVQYDAIQAFCNSSFDVQFSGLQASVNDFLTANPGEHDEVVDVIATALRNVLADPNFSTTSIKIHFGNHAELKNVKPESITEIHAIKVARVMVNNILAGTVKANALDEIALGLADPKAYAASSVPSTPTSLAYAVSAPVVAKAAPVVAKPATVAPKAATVVASTPVKAAATAPSFVGASPELQAKLAKRLSMVEGTKPAAKEEVAAVKPASPPVPARPVALLKQLEAKKAQSPTLKQVAVVTVEAPKEEEVAVNFSATKPSMI